MTFFIILAIFLLITYIISFNNRDKSQDYKLYQNRFSPNLSKEEIIRIDITTDLEVGIKEIIKNNKNPISQKQQIIDFIIDSEGNFTRKIGVIAKEHNIQMYKVEDIIIKCCDDIHKKYINQ